MHVIFHSPRPGATGIRELSKWIQVGHGGFHEPPGCEEKAGVPSWRKQDECKQRKAIVAWAGRLGRRVCRHKEVAMSRNLSTAPQRPDRLCMESPGRQKAPGPASPQAEGAEKT